MSSYNHITLVGNLVRDPEIHYISTTGTAVTKFALAVNNPRKKEQTLFVDIVAWDKLAEVCNTFLKKGANVLVAGRLEIRSYQAKDETSRKATEVVIDTMQMLGSKRPENGAAVTDGANAAASDANPKDAEYEEDLNF